MYAHANRIGDEDFALGQQKITLGRQPGGRGWTWLMP